MDSLIRRPGEPREPHPSQRGIAPSGGGRQNLVQRLLHRADSAGNAPTGSRSSSPSSRRSMIDRLESFFAEDLPSSMEVLPKQPQEQSAPTPVETAEKAGQTGKPVETKASESRQDSESSAFSAVRLIRIAAKDAMDRSQEAFREIESRLGDHAKELERREAALTVASDAASASLQEFHAKLAEDLSVRLEATAQPLLDRSVQQLREQSAAALSALQEKLDHDRQNFIAETEKQFETLRASRQLFIDDTQKQLAATAQSSLDSLTKAAVERSLADLDTSRQRLLDETQTQLTSAGRASLGPLTRDLSKELIEKVQGELSASKQAFVDETQGQLAQMIQASQQVLRSFVAATVEQANSELRTAHKQILDDTREQVGTITRASLETEIKTAVEQGRTNLRGMVDAFLAKAVPQIETELEKLVSRRTEPLRNEPAVAQAPPLRASAPTAAPARASLALASAEIAAPQTASSARAPLGLTTSQIAAERAAEARPVAAVRAFPSPGRSLDFKLAESAPKPAIDKRDLWAGISSGLKLGLGLAAIAVIAFMIYFFTSPVVRLRATPPAAFFDDNPSWTAKQRAHENDLARAYWNVAVTAIEAQYAFGTVLPSDPPAAFQVGANTASGEAATADQSTRTRYWQKLREVWPQADSWERTSSQGTTWLRSFWETASWKMSHLFNSSTASASP